MNAPLPPLILLCLGESSPQAPGLFTLSSGQTWLAQQLENFAQAGVQHVVLVTDGTPETYRKALPWNQSLANVQIVSDDRAKLGTLAALQCGLEMLPPTSPAFVCPVEIPCPPATLLQTLSKAGLNTGAHALVPSFEGQSGHPVLVNAVWAEELRARPAGSTHLSKELGRLPPDAVKKVSCMSDQVLKPLRSKEDVEGARP